MHDLIFFASRLLRTIDSRLLSDEYRHNQWFKLCDVLNHADNPNSRVSRLPTPWSLSPTINPIPIINNDELRFEVVIDSIIDELCKTAVNSNRSVYVLWSGGIDSTCILSAILQVANREFLENLVIVLDQSSITENTYFYYQFIHNRLKVIPVSEFKIDSNNYDKIIVVDGEGGNQCLQGFSVQKLIYRKQFDLLNQPWRSQSNLKNLLLGSNDFQIELITESIKYSPVSIDTGYDFLWWTNFNFKFDDVMIRKMFVYCQDLNPSQTKHFWNNCLYRPFRHADMQMWSMTARDLRRHYATTTTVKYFAKKYIYDFDHNDFYYSSKLEQGSAAYKLKNSHPILYLPYFAFDSDWNKYSIADPKTRQELGKILEII
jgi:hypothetical protein